MGVHNSDVDCRGVFELVQCFHEQALIRFMTCVRSLVKQKCVLVHLSQFSLQCCGSFLFPSALINLDCPLQIWTWKLNWNPFQNNPFCNVCGESFTWLQNCQYKNFVGFFPSHALFCSYVALNLKPRQAACLLTEVSPKKSRFIVRTIITLNSCQIVPTIVRFLVCLLH